MNKFAHVVGGADRHVVDLARILRDNGHDVRVLSTASARNQLSEGLFVPLAVTNANRDSLAPAAQLRVAAQSLWNRSAARSMKRLIADFSPDVVHLHKLYPQLSVSAVVAAAKRAATVQTVHDWEFIVADPEQRLDQETHPDSKRLRYHLLERSMYLEKRLLHAPRVDQWILPSTALANEYRLHGIDGTVLPHFAAQPPANPLPFSERSGVLFAGRLTEAKGVMDVVDMARRSDDIPFAIAGDGELSEWVKEQSSEIPMLTYLGFLDPAQVRQRMEAARIVIIPSYLPEAAGLTALEAMTVGTPAVAFRSGGLPEYVIDGSTGRLAADAVELERLSYELYWDELSWARLSAKCLNRSAGEHDAGSYVTSLLREYDRARSSSVDVGSLGDASVLTQSR